MTAHAAAATDRGGVSPPPPPVQLPAPVEACASAPTRDAGRADGRGAHDRGGQSRRSGCSGDGGGSREPGHAVSGTSTGAVPGPAPPEAPEEHPAPPQQASPLNNVAAEAEPCPWSSRNPALAARAMAPSLSQSLSPPASATDSAMPTLPPPPPPQPRLRALPSPSPLPPPSPHTPTLAAATAAVTSVASRQSSEGSTLGESGGDTLVGSSGGSGGGGDGDDGAETDGSSIHHDTGAAAAACDTAGAAVYARDVITTTITTATTTSSGSTRSSNSSSSSSSRSRSSSGSGSGDGGDGGGGSTCRGGAYEACGSGGSAGGGGARGVRCLITGGCGYVGLFLARQLLAEGHEVVLFDLCPPTAAALEASARYCGLPDLDIARDAVSDVSSGSDTAAAATTNNNNNSSNNNTDYVTAARGSADGASGSGDGVGTEAAAAAAAAASASAAAAVLAGRSLSSTLPPRCRLVLGDLRRPDDVAAACAGVHSVFHVASYGMSGAESLRSETIRAVNVGGTAGLLAAAAAAGARRLVLVSSYNAVWTRQVVRGGGEDSAPYLPYSSYPDEYSRTKAMAEQMVLAANGTPLPPPPRVADGEEGTPARSESRGEGSTGGGGMGGGGTGGGQDSALHGLEDDDDDDNYDGDGVGDRDGDESEEGAGEPGGGGGYGTGTNRMRRPAGRLRGPRDGTRGRCAVLRTCAVRPPGIYGPGELRHTPRILSYARSGLLCFRFGRRDALSDWIHVRNLVTSILAAWRGLGASRRHIAAGRAYFVSDGRPINTFDFWAPLLRGLGYSPPQLVLPMPLVAAAAHAMVAAHTAAAAAAAAAVAAAAATSSGPGEGTKGGGGGAGGAGGGGGTSVLSSGLQRAVAALEPWMTPAEVYKTGTEHWYRPERARAELGWEPQQYDFAEILESYKSYAAVPAAAAASDLQPLTATGLAVVGPWVSLVLASLGSLARSVVAGGGGGGGAAATSTRSASAAAAYGAGGAASGAAAATAGGSVQITTAAVLGAAGMGAVVADIASAVAAAAAAAATAAAAPLALPLPALRDVGACACTTEASATSDDDATLLPLRSRSVSGDGVSNSTSSSASSSGGNGSPISVKSSGRGGVASVSVCPADGRDGGLASSCSQAALVTPHPKHSTAPIRRRRRRRCVAGFGAGNYTAAAAAAAMSGDRSTNSCNSLVSGGNVTGNGGGKDRRGGTSTSMDTSAGCSGPQARSGACGSSSCCTALLDATRGSQATDGSARVAATALQPLLRLCVAAAMLVLLAVCVVRLSHRVTRPATLFAVSQPAAPSPASAVAASNLWEL